MPLANTSESSSRSLASQTLRPTSFAILKFKLIYQRNSHETLLFQHCAVDRMRLNLVCRAHELAMKGNDWSRKGMWSPSSEPPTTAAIMKLDNELSISFHEFKLGRSKMKIVVLCHCLNR